MADHKKNGRLTTTQCDQTMEVKTKKKLGSFRFPSLRSRSKSRDRLAQGKVDSIVDTTGKDKLSQQTHPAVNGIIMSPEEQQSLRMRKRTSSSVLRRVKPNIEHECNHTVSLTYQDAIDSLLHEAGPEMTRYITKEYAEPFKASLERKKTAEAINKDTVELSDSIVNINTAISCEFINDIHQRYSPGKVHKDNVGLPQSNSTLIHDLSPEPPNISQTLPRNFKAKMSDRRVRLDVTDSLTSSGTGSILESPEKGTPVSKKQNTHVTIVGLSGGKSPVKILSNTRKPARSSSYRSRSESPTAVFTFEAPSDKHKTASLPSHGKFVRRSTPIKQSLRHTVYDIDITSVSSISTPSSRNGTPTRQRLTFSPEIDIQETKHDGTVLYVTREDIVQESPPREAPGKGHVKAKISMFENGGQWNRGFSLGDLHVQHMLAMTNDDKKTQSMKNLKTWIGGDEVLQAKSMKKLVRSHDSVVYTAHTADENEFASLNSSHSILEQSIGRADQTDSPKSRPHSVTDDNYMKLVQAASGYKYNDYGDTDLKKSVVVESSRTSTIPENNNCGKENVIVNGDLLVEQCLTNGDCSMKSSSSNCNTNPSANKHKQLSDSYRLSEVGQGQMEDIDQVIVQVNGSIDKDGNYFMAVVEKEEGHLHTLCDGIETDLEDSSIPEEASGKLRAAHGKANLLVSKKFKQFRALCHKNLNPELDDPFSTTSQDLEGFWDMVCLQVEEVGFLFDEINALRKNGWKELSTPEKQNVLKRTPSNSSRDGTSGDKGTGAKPKVRIKKSDKDIEAKKRREQQAKARDEARKRLLAAKKAAGRRQRTSSSGDDHEVEIFTPR